MTLLQSTHSTCTKCGVFTSGLQILTKIWVLSHKKSLGVSDAQQASNTNIVTRPQVTLLVRMILHEDIPILPG